MKIELKAALLGITGLALAACAPAELPESPREGRRVEGGNADLRLPSQWGGMPADRSRWWHAPETRYPNAGYYSSEGR
jgi:hypothetical protein